MMELLAKTINNFQPLYFWKGPNCNFADRESGLILDCRGNDLSFLKIGTTILQEQGISRLSDQVFAFLQQLLKQNCLGDLRKLSEMETLMCEGHLCKRKFLTHRNPVINCFDMINFQCYIVNKVNCFIVNIFICKKYDI